MQISSTVLIVVTVHDKEVRVAAVVSQYKNVYQAVDPQALSLEEPLNHPRFHFGNPSTLRPNHPTLVVECVYNHAPYALVASTVVQIYKK